MELKIYSNDGKLKLTVEPRDNSTQVEEIQAGNVLNVSFILPERVSLGVNDYADFMRRRYWLTEEYRPVQKSTVEWEYSLKLYGLENLISRFLVLDTTDGGNGPVLSLTAPPREHVALIVKSINAGFGTDDWKVGTVEGGKNIVVDYHGRYCDAGLKAVADATGTEYWIEGTTVNLCRCEHGERVALGYQNGLTRIQPDVADNAKVYTRLFPTGSSKNIDPAKYGHSRLQLPGGTQYVDVNTDKYGIIHHYEENAFADIFPRYTGTVSSVRSEERTNGDGEKYNVYYFKDNDLPFDPNQYDLGTLVKRVTFQEGSELAGLGSDDNGTHYFEIDFDSDTREFEIATQFTDSGHLPGGVLVPKPGDRFIPWNMRMPDEYYALAEAEFLEAVNRFNEEHCTDIAVFKARTDHVWIEDNEVDLFVGRRVRLESREYFPETGYKDSRITRITRKVNLPSQMDIEIGDALGRSAMQSVSDSISEVRSYARSIAGSISLPDIIRTGDRTEPTDNNLYSARRSDREFIHRNRRDTVSEILRFMKGLESGEYKPGITGGFFGTDPESGDSFAEVARLYVRVKAFFEELTVIKAGVLAGKQYITPGGGIRCTRVEEITDGSGSLTAYRCWFLSEQDGEKTECKFIAGDQAISEMFNAKAGTANKVSNHRYWRLVTAVDNDALTDDGGNHYGYIELSASDCETGSDMPQTGDEICQLGSRDNPARQTAMVFSTVDADAPSIRLFGGIDSYSLDGKAVVSFGRDPLSGKIFFRLGADGAKQYLHYTQDGGLVVAGKISSKSTYDDGSGNDATLGDVINDRIADTDILFISHTSQTVAPVLPLLAADGIIAQLNGWTTDAPAAQAGLYIWQTTYVLRGDGTASFVGTACVTGRDGSSYTENLLTGTRDFTGEWSYLDRGTVTSDTYKGCRVFEITRQWGATNKPVHLEPGTYTFSAYARVSSQEQVNIYVNAAQNTQPVIGTEWQRVRFVFRVDTAGTYNPRIEKHLATSTVLYTAGWKVEEGDNPNPVWSPAPAEQVGQSAKTVIVNSDATAFMYEDNFNKLTGPNTINLTATLQGTTGYQWSYKTPSMAAFVDMQGMTSATYSLPPTASGWGSDKSMTLRCTSGGVHDEVTIAKVSSGAKGSGYTHNLLLNTAFTNGFDKWYNWGTPTTREVVTENGKSWFHLVANADSMYQGLDQATRLDVVNGATYTFSALVRGSAPDQQFSFGVHYVDANMTIVAQTWQHWRIGTTSQRVERVFGVWNNPAFLRVMIGRGDKEESDIYITDVKLEKGENHATVWSPAASEMLGTPGEDGASYSENLLLKSGTPVSNDFYNIANYFFGEEKPVDGEVYTLTIWGEPAAGVAFLAINSGGDGNKGSVNLSKIADGVYSGKWTWKNFSGNNPGTHIALWCRTSGSRGTTSISRIKFEKGDNHAPVWTPNSSEMVGTDAYTVLLTNESHTFAGDSEKAVESSTDCGIVAYKGATQIAATIGAISGMPSGMTAAVSGNGTTSARFTVSVTTALTQRQGTLSVPVTVDGKTFTKKFSWSLSLEGKGAHSIYLKGWQTNNNKHSSRVVMVDGKYVGLDNRRGLRLVTLNRETLKMVTDILYDTYADTPSNHPRLDSLIGQLESLDDSVFVTLTSADAMSLSQELINELSKFGGMIDTVVWQARHAFAFIGYKGLQPGYAQWMIDKTVGTSTSAPAEVSAYVANGMFTTSKTQNGVKSITEEYYLSTSRDTPTGGSWSATRPAWVAGRFYWTRVKITYTDGTTEYKGAICATGEAGPGYTSNMLPGTKDWSGWRVDSGYSKAGTYNGLDVMHGTSPSSGYRDLVLVGKTDLEADTVYTLSVWAKGTGSFVTYVYESVTAQILNIDGTVSSSSASNTEARHLLTSQWKRHYVVFRTIAGITITGRHLIASRLYVDGSEIWVAGAKLEKGENHDTQWSPYPSEQYGLPGVDATFSPNLVPSILYDPNLKGGGSTNAMKWIGLVWGNSELNNLRIDLIGKPIKEAGWYSVYFMARRVSGAGAVSVDINDCGITVTPDLSTIDGDWRAFSGKVYVNKYIGVNGFIDFMNGDGIELSDITVTKGEAVPASWLPTAPELTGGSDNLLLRSDVEVSNAGYPIASYRIAETLSNNETLACTIWGDLKGGATRWGVYNSSGSHILAYMYRVADGVYSAVFKWVTNTDTNNDTLVVYPMDRTDTSAVSTIRRIKLERGTIPTPWSRSSHDFDFITAAMKQDTEVINGLILSALMKLGVKDASGVRRIMAGINGLVNSSDDLALWAGGDMVDADKFPNDPDRAAAAIRHNGTAYFARNVIRMLSDYMMVGDNVRLDKDGLKLMVDGDTSLEITNRDVYTDFQKLASNQTRFSYNARIGPSIGVESGNSVIVEETYDAVSLGKIEAGTQVVVNIALEGVQDSRNFGNGSVNSPFNQPLTVIAHCGSTAVHQTTMPVHSMTVTHNDDYGRPSWSEHTYRIIGTTTFTASRTGTYEIEITFLKESSAAMLGWFSLEGTMSGTVKLALSNQMTIGRNGLSVIRNNNALAINDSMVVMRSDRFGFALHPTLGPVITLNSGTNWYAAQLSGSQILFNKRVSL